MFCLLQDFKEVIPLSSGLQFLMRTVLTSVMIFLNTMFPSLPQAALTICYLDSQEFDCDMPRDTFLCLGCSRQFGSVVCANKLGKFLGIIIATYYL